MEGIHGPFISNWNGAPWGSYRQKSGNETSIPRKATTVAYQAMAFLDSLLKKRRPRAPTRGRKVMVVRIQLLLMVPRTPLAVPEEVNAHEQKNPEHEDRQIGLHQSCLQAPEGQTQPSSQVRRRVDQAVYHELIEEA